MKRCGQWLFMLWVAAALLYPQAVTAVSRSHDRTSQLIQNQVQSLPLIADCSFKETGKVDAKPCTAPDNAEQIQGEGALRVALPPLAVHSPLAAKPGQPVIEEARGRLPFVCGPPAQNQ